MIRYAITDGSRFGEDLVARRDALMDDARRWAAAGVEYVQVREKDLAEAELIEIARAMMRIFRESGGGTKLLVNAPLRVAMESEADGVHLTAAEGSVAQVRGALEREIVVSASCHAVEEVRARAGADLILFGPVFEKRVLGEVVVAGVGLAALYEACAAVTGTKVLALGGVTDKNAGLCVGAGAAGVAAIRMFQPMRLPGEMARRV